MGKKTGAKSFRWFGTHRVFSLPPSFSLPHLQLFPLDYQDHSELLLQGGGATGAWTWWRCRAGGGGEGGVGKTINICQETRASPLEKLSQWNAAVNSQGKGKNTLFVLSFIGVSNGSLFLIEAK